VPVCGQQASEQALSLTKEKKKKTEERRSRRRLACRDRMIKKDIRKLDWRAGHRRREYAAKVDCLKKKKTLRDVEASRGRSN
jgi:hypothetical protein